MPRVLKPMAVKVLEGRKDQLSKAKKSGQDKVAAVQRRALELIEGVGAVRDWGEMRTAPEFLARFIREFEGMPLYYKVDVAMLGLAADSLERYHTMMDAWRAESDAEVKMDMAGAIQREAKTFVSFASRLGLDPASRDKFLLNSSLRAALDDKEEFQWDLV